MNLSLVIPLLNEEESLQELSDWIMRVCSAHNFSYEVLFVDDGSRDGSWKKIEEISSRNNNVKGIRFRRNYGKSAALQVGFEVAQGDVVITMDADLQDSPDEIPELYKMITKDNFDLVSGWKKKRYDPITKTIPTKIFNWATRKMSGIQLHDFNCGLKAYKNEVVKNVDVYGEMHRYIPVLAGWAGFRKIGEKVVTHQKRKYGTTKFGLERFINGFLDLLSIGFVTKFGKRPMHLFGLLGTIIFFFGFVVACYLAYLKFGLGIVKMTDRPLFYFGLLAMIIGTQLFLTGFISELIVRHSPDKNKYQIEKKVGL
ncbi:MAG: glycosyltransferase [Bacteroidetes bacterium]|nr:glycosyltransferase [Bacteroidota bacterium]